MSDLKTILVPWNKEQTGFWWNETCAVVVEVFGLPGDRYETNPSHDAMFFDFKNKKDADLCRILLSERL